MFLAPRNSERKEAKTLIAACIEDKLKQASIWRLLTQEELAERAEVSPSTVVNIERDNAESHFRTIRKPTKVLDVDPATPP